MDQSFVYQAIVDVISGIVVNHTQRVFPSLVKDFLPFRASERTVRRRMAEMAEQDLLYRRSRNSGYSLIVRSAAA